jgi:hypothetical protein
MKTECSLPFSQQPATDPDLTQHNTVHTLHATTIKSILILSSKLRQYLSKELFRLGFVFISNDQYACHMPCHSIFLAFIALISVDEHNKL